MHGYQDDFEKEMEQLLDDMAYEDDFRGEPSNPADALLKTLSTLAEIDEYISVYVYLVLHYYIMYCALTLRML